MMAASSSTCSVECSVISVPSLYFETLQINNDSINLYLGSNTILINEKSRFQLCLKRRSNSNIFWAVLTFNLRFRQLDLEKTSFVTKRLVQIVVDQNVNDGVVVVSDDLLFNLKYNLSQSSLGRTSPKDISFVTLNNESDETIPTKASKVKLSVFQPDTSLENSFIDKLLHKYFSYPRYLCNDDVFGVHVGKDFILDVSSIVNNSIVYFKVCDLQGHATGDSDSSDIFKGYLVDTSVTLYQVASHQGFFPSRRIPVCLKPNLHSLLCDSRLIKRLETNSHNLVPPSFDDVFNTMCLWMKPFLCTSERIKDVDLNAVFLLTGPNGSGKTLLVQALSDLFGTSFCRVDCVSLGGAVPGQAEAKVKALFSQLKNLAPCVLQLANIESLCQDADSKEDIRVISCFEQQVKALRLRFPVVIVATSQSSKSVSSNLHHLFLDSASVSAPSCPQREDCLSWLAHYSGQPEDRQILHSVASLTSGFVFRDLQVLIALASKEKYLRSKSGAKENAQFVLSDFSKIVGSMHKVYSESIGAPKVPSVSWKDVGGLEHLKKEILRSLKSNIFNTGLRRSGLLLHGPPGTGKTLLAKAVATQCGRNFLSVKGPELLNMYVGQSEHNVRDLFELAKAASPCIVFFDELDSLAPNRGRSGDSGGVMDRVVSQLLAEMDDLGTSGDVFILGATNRPDLLDPALLRPGRLDKMLFVGPCEDPASKLSVLTALTHKLCLAPDVDLHKVLSLLPTSVTGAQLSALCSASWMSAARQTIHSGDHKKTAVAVCQEHFISGLKTVFNQQ